MESGAPKNDSLKILKFIQQAIYNLNDKNISQTVQSLINFLDNDEIYSFNLLISQIIFCLFKHMQAKMEHMETYLNFIKEIEKFEENYQSKYKIIDVFTNFLINEHKQESNYLLEYMAENNFINPKVVLNTKSSYFVHYMSKNEIKSLTNDPFMYQIINNYEELSKNDWELHKKLIKEGHNTNEIAKIIRNDEIEKLQEISSQNDFNFNQTIKSSLYERNSFVNFDCSLIDYAAFFGSIKCFKYLMLNNANIKNTLEYAVASGNLEIIHLCVQNNSSKLYLYQTAIEFHRNDIFKYLYENKICKIKNLSNLGKKCVLYHNYDIFALLEKEGMKINKDIINESAKIGNIFLLKYLLQNHPIPNDILVTASESGNIELVKYILDRNEININNKNICFH